MTVRRYAVLVVALSLSAACGSLIVRPQTLEGLLRRDGFAWTVHEVPGFGTLQVEAGGLEPAEIERAARGAVAAEATVAGALGIEAYEPEVTVFLVGSRERMEALIGRHTNATGYHASDTVCLVWRRAGSAGLTHELFHVAAMNLWGVPERWINEGLAVEVTGRWSGHELHSVARSLDEQGSLPSLATLTTRFGKLPSAVSYPAAGSLVRFVRAEFGDNAVRRLWDEGAASLDAAGGFSFGDLEARWRERVAAAPALHPPYDPRALTP